MAVGRRESPRQACSMPAVLRKANSIAAGSGGVFVTVSLICFMVSALVEPSGANSPVRARMVSNRSKLSSHLLSGYDASQPPDLEGLSVDVQLALLNLVDISTAQENIQLHAWWRMYWKDPGLTWDMNEWGVKHLTFKFSQIWSPDIIIFEQIKQEESAQVLSTVYPDGSVFVSHPRVITVGCNMNLTDYPFDVQYCAMTIGSWSYDGTVVDVKPRPVSPDKYWLEATSYQWANSSNAPSHASLDLAEFKARPNAAEFDLKAIRVITKNVYYGCCPEPFPVIEIEFELHRGLLTIMFGMMIPILMVTCVGFCSLMMPAPVSGARPALSVTVMLTTATVYLVASRLTPQSNSSTVLSRFYIACFLVNAALVLISIMNTALNSVQPDDKVSSDCLRKIFTHFDVDSSGYLDRAEAGLALKALGITATEQLKVYEVFDADKDERISMEEFLAIGELTKKNNNLSTFHNYWTMFLIRSKMWQHEWMRTHQQSSSFEIIFGIFKSCWQRIRHQGGLLFSSMHHRTKVADATSNKDHHQCGAGQIEESADHVLELEEGKAGTEGGERVLVRASYSAPPAPKDGFVEESAGDGQEETTALKSTDQTHEIEETYTRAPAGTSTGARKDLKNLKQQDGNEVGEATPSTGVEHYNSDVMKGEESLLAEALLDDTIDGTVDGRRRARPSFKRNANLVKHQMDSVKSFQVAGSRLAQQTQSVHAFSHLRSTPQMWGRHISASVDFWSFVLLPIFFTLYIGLEFSGRLVGALSGSSMSGSLDLMRAVASTPPLYNHTGIIVHTTDLRDPKYPSGRCYETLQYLSPAAMQKKVMNYRDRTKSSGMTCDLSSNSVLREDPSMRREGRGRGARAQNKAKKSSEVLHASTPDF